MKEKYGLYLNAKNGGWKEHWKVEDILINTILLVFFDKMTL